MHNDNWPLDNPLWINGVEAGAWTCSRDFGGDRGRLTPEWWDIKDSQYWVLKRWIVSLAGSFVDGYPMSRVTLRDLGIAKTTYGGEEQYTSYTSRADHL